jgi:hypothetical protein
MKSQILSIILCVAMFSASAQEQKVDSTIAAQPTIVDVSGKLKIYPNPSSNWLFITHPVVSKKGTQIIITDVNGKTALKADVKTETSQSIFNISSLTSGIYYVIWSGSFERGRAVIIKN